MLRHSRTRMPKVGLVLKSLCCSMTAASRCGWSAGPRTLRLRSIFRTAANFLVLDGDFGESGEHFTLQSWLRLPPQGRLDATAGRDGCRLWVKTGHLRHIQVPPRTEE